MKKIISIIICTCFLFSFVFNKSIYAFVNMRMEYVTNYQTINPSIIPTNYGKILEQHFTDSNRVIVNIQDLHCHPQTQKNISNILEIIDKRYGLTNIYLEGAYGQINTTWIKNLSKNKQIDIINKMLDSGRLTGAEYYSIKSNKYNIIKGLEKKEPYLQNLKTLSYLLNSQEEINAILQAINDSTQNLKQKYYSKELLELEELTHKYSSNKTSVKKYYDFLLQQSKKFNIDLRKYSNITTYTQLLNITNKLNTKSINNQLLSLLFNLKQVLPYSEYKALLEQTNNFVQIDILYEQLIQLQKRYNLEIEKQYPQLYKYFEITSLNKKLNPIELVNEEEFLIKTISENYAQNKAQREVIFLTYFYRYLNNYLNTKITATDYQYYKENIDKFKSLWNEYVDNKLLLLLDKYIIKADKFYKINLDRNYYFTNNIFNKLNNTNNTQVDVVITGGFHSQTINKILRDKNISYIVITPNVTGNVDFANSTYQKLVQEQSNIAYQTLATQPFSALSKEDKIKIITYNYGKDVAVEMFGTYIYPQKNEIKTIQTLSDKLHDTIIKIQEQKFLTLDDTKSAIEILEDVLNEKLDPQIIEYIDFERLKQAFNKIDYKDDVKSIVEHAKKLHKSFLPLQDEPTQQILDNIGKAIYKNNIIKAYNFKYSTVALVLTSLFELFPFWKFNFVSKYHKNNNIFTHIAHGTIIAISLACGIGVILNPISNMLIIPSILATEFVLHFIYDVIVVKLNKQWLLQSNSYETNNEKVTLTQEELYKLNTFIQAHTEGKRIFPEDINNFINLLQEIDFNDLLINYGTIPIFKNNKALTLKNNLLSFFSDEYINNYNKLGYDNYNYLCSTIIKLVLYNKDFSKRIDYSTYRMIASVNSNASINKLVNLKVFSRLAAYVDWNNLCNDNSTTDSRLTDKKFLHSLMHIYESHSTGFNAESNQRKQFYDFNAGEYAQNFSISYQDVHQIPNILAEPDLVIFTGLSDYSNNITFIHIKKIDNDIYCCVTNSLGDIVSFYKLSHNFYLQNNFLNISNILSNFAGDIYVNANSNYIDSEILSLYNNFEDMDDLTRRMDLYTTNHTVFIKDYNLCITNDTVYSYGDILHKRPLLKFNNTTNKFETDNRYAQIMYDTDDGQIIKIKDKYFYFYGKYFKEIQEYNGNLKTNSDFYFIFLDNLYSISNTDNHFTQISTDEKFKLEIDAINKILSYDTDKNDKFSEDINDNNKSKEFNALYPLLQKYLSENNVTENTITIDTINNFINEQEKNVNDILELLSLADTIQEQILLELEYAILGTSMYELFKKDILAITNKIKPNLSYSKEKWISIILQTLTDMYGDDFDFTNIYTLGFYQYKFITINDFIEEYNSTYTIDYTNPQQAVLDKIKYDFFDSLNHTNENRIKRIIDRHFNNVYESISSFELNEIIAIILEDLQEKDCPVNMNTPHICYKNNVCHVITTTQDFINFYKLNDTQKLDKITNDANVSLEQSILAQLYYGIFGNKEFNRQKSKIIESVSTILDDNLTTTENIINILKNLIDNGVNCETEIACSFLYNNTLTILDFIKRYDPAYFLQQKRNDVSIKADERIILEFEYGILGHDSYAKYSKEISKNITPKMCSGKYQESYLISILEKLVENNSIKEFNANIHIYLPEMYDNAQTVGELIKVMKELKIAKEKERKAQETERIRAQEAKKFEKQKQNNINNVLNSRQTKIDSSYSSIRINEELYTKIRMELSYGILNEDIFRQNSKQIKQIINNIAYCPMDNETYFNFVLATILGQLINTANSYKVSAETKILIPELYLGATTIGEFINLSMNNMKNNKEQLIEDILNTQNFNTENKTLLGLQLILDYNIYFQNINKIKDATKYIMSYYFVEDNSFDTNLLVALTLKQLVTQNDITYDTPITDYDNSTITVKEFITKYATIEQRMALSTNALQHIRASFDKIDLVISERKLLSKRDFTLLGEEYNQAHVDILARTILLDSLFPSNQNQLKDIFTTLRIKDMDVLKHIDDLKDFIIQQFVSMIHRDFNTKTYTNKEMMTAVTDTSKTYVRQLYTERTCYKLTDYIQIINLYNIIGEKQKEVLVKEIYNNPINETYDNVIDRICLTAPELALLRSFKPIDIESYKKVFNLPNLTESELVEMKIFAFLKSSFICSICYDFKEEIMAIIKEEVKNSNITDINSIEMFELTDKIVHRLVRDGLISNELLDINLDQRLYKILPKQDEEITDDDLSLLNNITNDKNVNLFSRLFTYLRAFELNTDNEDAKFEFYKAEGIFTEFVEREIIDVKQLILSHKKNEFNALLYMIFGNIYIILALTNLRNLSKANLLLILQISKAENEEIFNKYFTVNDAIKLILESPLNFTDYIFIFMIYAVDIYKCPVDLDALSKSMTEQVQLNPTKDNFEIWKDILAQYFKLTYDKKVNYKNCKNAIELFEQVCADIKKAIEKSKKHSGIHSLFKKRQPIDPDIIKSLNVDIIYDRGGEKIGQIDGCDVRVKYNSENNLMVFCVPEELDVVDRKNDLIELLNKNVKNGRLIEIINNSTDVTFIDVVDCYDMSESLQIEPSQTQSMLACS